MIAKARKSAGLWSSKKARHEPLDIQLSVAFRFGDAPADRISVIEDRSVPLVGTVFESRDTIFRNFARLLLKAAAQRPHLLAELLPGAKLVGGRARRKKP